MTTTFQVKSLSLNERKSYLLTTLFIIANVLLPQLFHTLNLGGERFLPILLFTLVSAAAYGLSVGMLTAILSPVASMLLFGMPSPEMCIILVAKGITLALVLGYFAGKFSKISLKNIITSIIAYQVVGIIVSTLVLGSIDGALSSVLISYPAMLLQLTLGTIIIKYLPKK